MGETQPPPPPELDVWRVTLLHASMHAGEIGWPHLLNSINVDYLTLHHHDIVTRLNESVQHTAHFVGIELPDGSTPPSPALCRQADAATEAFVEEWSRATGGCAACENDKEG